MNPSSSVGSKAVQDSAATLRIDYSAPVVRIGLGVVGGLLLLLIWHLTAISGILGTGLPTVTDTIREAFALLGTAQFWGDTATTIWLSALGLLIALAAGVLLGLLIGTIDWVRYSTLAVTEFLKPIPPIVLLPLCVMIWGPTNLMALVLVLIGTVLSTTIQVIAGVNDTDPVALNTARSFGMGRAERLWRITLPSATPYIGTSVRIGAPSALIIVVVAGLLGGAPGLGSTIYRAQASGDYPRVYALVLVLGVLGLLAQNSAAAIERRVLHWHPAFRQETK